MSGHFNHFQAERINTIEPSATASVDYTLTSKQSGSIIFLKDTNLVDTCTIRLPPPDYGLNFKFIVTTAAGSQNRVNIRSYNSSNVLTSLINVHEQLNANAGEQNTLTLDMNGIDVSDTFDIICDGTKWYANGVVNNTGKYT